MNIVLTEMKGPTNHFGEPTIPGRTFLVRPRDWASRDDAPDPDQHAVDELLAEIDALDRAADGGTIETSDGSALGVGVPGSSAGAMAPQTEPEIDSSLRESEAHRAYCFPESGSSGAGADARSELAGC